MREALLKTVVLAGAACVSITEVLSLFHAFTRAGVIAGWMAVAILAAAALWRIRPKFARPKLVFVDAIFVAVVAAILIVVARTALVYPPNSADAMAYHLPRVMYWIQNGSVAFFPTPYLNQIMLQPFAEYAMAHTYLLSGGDHFVNLIQWTGFAGSILAVSLIAQAMGLSRFGQGIAALSCATLPNAILQASGAKNDCVLSLCLAAAVYFCLRKQVWFLGLALGLAIGAKATAYLFAPPLLLAIWAITRRNWREISRDIVAIASVAVLLNLPQFTRNFQLSGSILGFDSAFGDGSFRWRNDHPGWKPAVSNILRNFSEQLGGRSEAANQRVFDTVVKIHAALGLNPQDPATTWQWSQYVPPRNANHEADANNRWHLLFIVLAFGWAVLRRKTPWLWYGSGLAAAFLGFCFYLKWQPFFSRLELPLFVLGAPLIASLLVSLQPMLLPFAVCLFLLDGTRHPLFENWTRPLHGPRGPRDLAYFNDMTQFHNRDLYFTEVDRVLSSGCETVGIDINQNQLEYPLQALLKEKNPRMRFVHVNVHNPSLKFHAGGEPQPCITVALR